MPTHLKEKRKQILPCRLSNGSFATITTHKINFLFLYFRVRLTTPWQVYAGMLALSKKDAFSVQMRFVDAIITHPDYTGTSPYDFDISLIKVSFNIHILLKYCNQNKVFLTKNLEQEVK